jgi:hypothetical protein
MPDPKLFLIEWQDATFALDPQDIALTVQVVRTVGWIIREDALSLVIASERNEGVASGWRQVTSIPLSLITKRTELRKR